MFHVHGYVTAITESSENPKGVLAGKLSEALRPGGYIPASK